jgi:hypothetical protein
MVVSSSESITNNNLNLSNYISCEEEGMGGSKLIDSVYVIPSENNKFALSKGTCSNILYDSTSNNLCGCSIIDMNNGKIECPQNTFLRKILPESNKGVCCRPCMDNNITITTDSRICRPIIKTTSDNIKCPDNSYVTKIDMSLKDPTITCCKPKIVEPESSVEQKSKLATMCGTMGLADEDCDQSNLDKLNNQCSTLGVSPCTVEELDNIEEKCGNYGMRYFNRKDNQYMNTDSPINCHSNNFEKLDTMCQKYGLDVCSIYGIQDYKDDQFASLEVSVRGPDMGDTGDTGDTEELNQLNQYDQRGKLLSSWSDYTAVGCLACLILILLISVSSMKR